MTPAQFKAKWAKFSGKESAGYQDHFSYPDARSVGTVRYPLTEPLNAECAAKLAKRTLTNLYNERPARFANAQAKLDAAVAAAYGCPADLSGEEIRSRLLALNIKRADDGQATAKNRPQNRA